MNTDKQEWLKKRLDDITSTEVSALFGLSPYATEFELWHRKKSREVVELASNERMTWGSRLESAIAGGIASDQGWDVVPLKEYLRLPELRMGSSFDFKIVPDGILEIKNVDSLAFASSWLNDGDTTEAPPHIELQVQHQLAVSGLSYAYIGALVGGNTVHLIKRTPNEKVIARIKSRVSQFWESIESNTPPEPDFKKDASFIASLYKHAEPGSIYDATSDSEIISLVDEYQRAGEIEREAKERKDAAKAQILMRVSDAEKVTGDTFTISLGIVGPARIEYDREAYRNFRIFNKKGKK